MSISHKKMREIENKINDVLGLEQNVEKEFLIHFFRDMFKYDDQHGCYNKDHYKYQKNYFLQNKDKINEKRRETNHNKKLQAA